MQAQVARHKRVLVCGRDENGKAIELDCEDGDEQGRAATCVQHELDHLDGQMYIDKVEPESLSWLIETVDEDGQDDVVLRPTTPQTIRNAYKTKTLPRDLHILPTLLERVMK